MPTQVYVAVVVILATVLDLALMFWLRYRQTRRGMDRSQVDGAVYLFGSYSPVLTWLKQRLAPKAQPPVQEPSALIEPEPEPGDEGLQGDLQAHVERVPVAASPATPGEQQHQQAALGRITSRQLTWLEAAVIALAVLVFCSGILDLRAETRLPGNESEIFQSLEWVLVNSLQQGGQFPLWNPYVRTGTPYVADPMLHIYNPVVTLPVLLLGVRAGFKLAIFLSFVLAAFGMWWLASVLGIGRPVRVWAALMYAFAGQPVARFFQGQYLFVLGFAWIPWIVGSLWLVGRTRQRRYVALAAGFLALLFFSGNAYYQLYMVLTAGLCVLVLVVAWRPQPPFVSTNVPALKAYLLVALLALGLVAVQLLPLVELWPRMGKDLHLEGAHTLRQILLDYISKDTYRADSFSVLPAREEFYAYIGLSPILALGLLPFAIWKRERRSLVFFALLLVFVVAWISPGFSLWHELFVNSRFLLQFRHLLRILIFGSFAIIVLASMGLDTLWRSFSQQLDRILPASTQSALRLDKVNLLLGSAGLVLLGVYMLVGLTDLFKTHRQYVRSQSDYQPAYRVMSWLGQQDPGVYFLRHNPNNAWYEAITQSGGRNLDTWYHYSVNLDLAGAVNRRVVQAQPHYIIQSEKDPVPDLAGISLLSCIEGHCIYRLSGSLPIAFAVGNDRLLQGERTDPLQAGEVLPLAPFFSGPNSVEVIADGGSPEVYPLGGTLVVLVTRYPGWRVQVDGQSQRLKNVGGYLAVDLSPGVHKYTFSYYPVWFYIGLFVSLVAGGGALYLLASELRRFWLNARLQLRRAWDALRDLKDLPARRWPRPGVAAQAVYRHSALQLETPLNLPEEAAVRVMVEAEPASLPQLAFRRWLWATLDMLASVPRVLTLETSLFAAALAIYLFTRLVGLTQFPIYFFTDEAVQTLLAADLVANNFQDAYGDLLPTYFRNVDHYNLSTSVYLQVLPYLLFGKSTFVTRAASVLATLLAAVSVGLILRDIFKLPHWWSATLFLSIAPTWFLHSRTAFETVLMVSFYAAGLYYYLLYRYRSPRYLYVALILFALAFYSYSPGQVVVVVTGLLLLLSDARYHWQQRQVALRAMGLLTLLFLPYLRFRLGHPEAVKEHLANLNSYWILTMPLQEKITRFLEEYLYGLSPGYWFIPNERDLARHLMKGYGHLYLATLPLLVIGLLVSVKSFRSSAHRALLIALLAAPSGAALAQIAVTRALVMVVPATLLTAIGAITLLSWLEKRVRLSHQACAFGLLGVLGLFNIWMLRDTLTNGPTWYQDYGLGGMQYGGEQLFEAVDEYLQQHPGVRIIVSPTWANGPDVVARFFLSDPLPVQMGSIDEYMNQYLPLDDSMVFVMTLSEYEQVVGSGKFTDLNIEQTLPYPNGMPGFYFVRLRYVADIQAILEAEREARRQLQEDEIILEGQAVRVRHSMLDMGPIQAIFDENLRSVARTFEANPFILELSYPDLRPLSGFSMVIGDTEVRLLVRLYQSPELPPTEYVFELDGSVQNPLVSLDLEQVQLFTILYMEITDLRQGEPGHVHLWELNLR